MKIAQQPTVLLNVTIQLNEEEARALQVIADYGATEFLEGFGQDVGAYRIRYYEAGIHSLFTSLQAELRPILVRTDKARELFNT